MSKLRYSISAPGATICGICICVFSGFLNNSWNAFVDLLTGSGFLAVLCVHAAERHYSSNEALNFKITLFTGHLMTQSRVRNLSRCQPSSLFFCSFFLEGRRRPNFAIPSKTVLNAVYKKAHRSVKTCFLFLFQINLVLLIRPAGIL